MLFDLSGAGELPDFEEFYREEREARPAFTSEERRWDEAADPRLDVVA